MYSGDIITRHGHDRHALIEKLSSLSQAQIDQFCVEILSLQHFHQQAAGQWVTEMSDDFNGPWEGNFYRIRLQYDIHKLLTIPGWNEITQSWRDGKFDKSRLLHAISEMSDTRYTEFCDVILKLEYFHALAQGLAFIRDPDTLTLKNSSQKKEDFMFRLFSIEKPVDGPASADTHVNGNE